MQPRKTARVLLFDPQNRLLLVRMHDPDVGDAEGKVLAEPYWVTIGGEIDPGEDIATAARREVREETGLTDLRLGPPVWTTEHMLCIHGKTRRLQETFLPAWTESTTLARDAWSETERRVLQGFKWWTLAELQATNETIFPTSLVRHLTALLEGDIPASPLAIDP